MDGSSEMDPVLKTLKSFDNEVMNCHRAKMNLRGEDDHRERGILDVMGKRVVEKNQGN